MTQPIELYRSNLPSKASPNYLLNRKVNPVAISPMSDGRFGDLFRGIGLGDHSENMLNYFPPTSNRGELRERQTMFRWIIENQSTIKDAPFFAGEETVSTDNQGGLIMAPHIDYVAKSFPKDSHEFIQYQTMLREKTTPFWKRVASFSYAADSLYRTPQRLTDLVRTLEREGSIKYAEEVELCEEIVAEMRTVIKMSGILSFRVDNDKLRHGEPAISDIPSPSETWEPRKNGMSKICYGLWRYHAKLPPEYDPTESLFEKVARKCHMRIFAELSQYIRRQRGIAQAQIRTAPTAVVWDVAWHLNRKLEKDPFSFSQNCRIYVAYSLDETGLNMQIVDWDFSSMFDSSRLALFEGGELVNGLQLNRVKRLNGKYNHYVSKRQIKELDNEMGQWFIRNSERENADAVNTYISYCSLDFAAIHKKYLPRIQKMRAWQRRVQSAMNQLTMYNVVAQAVIKSGVPYCFPNIESRLPVLEVKSYYPVRFISEAKKEVYPFSSLAVNGQIVNLTGKNGSGKSTVMLAGLDVQVMAQCGMPVFAKSASVFLRNRILLSFLDRSSNDSTFRSKLTKDMAIIEAIKGLRKRERERTLVIVDELGSATDQVDVIGVAAPILDWLRKHSGTSILMSTQIFQLSEYIADLGGVELYCHPEVRDNSRNRQGRAGRSGRGNGIV